MYFYCAMTNCRKMILLKIIQFISRMTSFDVKSNALQLNSQTMERQLKIKLLFGRINF